MTLNQQHPGLGDAADCAAMASRVIHTFARIGVVALACAALPGISLAQNVNSKRPDTTVIVYDTFQKPGGHTLADYDAKWSTGFGIGEMALEDTRRFDNRTFSLSAAPFRTGADASVFDHSKYASVSRQPFAVPAIGSITFSRWRGLPQTRSSTWMPYGTRRLCSTRALRSCCCSSRRRWACTSRSA